MSLFFESNKIHPEHYKIHYHPTGDEIMTITFKEFKLTIPSLISTGYNSVYLDDNRDGDVLLYTSDRSISLGKRGIHEDTPGNLELFMTEKRLEQIKDIIELWEYDHMLCAWWAYNNDLDYIEIDFGNISADASFWEDDIQFLFDIEEDHTDEFIENNDFSMHYELFQKEYGIFKDLIKADTEEITELYFNYFNRIYDLSNQRKRAQRSN